jgi:hypothetical protein
MKTFKNIAEWGNAFLSQYKSHNQCTTALLCFFLKSFTPWRDSNPDRRRNDFFKFDFFKLFFYFFNFSNWIFLKNFFEGALFDPSVRLTSSDYDRRRVEAVDNFQNFLRPLLKVVLEPQEFDAGTRVVFEALQVTNDGNPFLRRLRFRFAKKPETQFSGKNCEKRNRGQCYDHIFLRF